MGFPSPAQDYIDERIDLQKLIVTRPASTFMMFADEPYWRIGVMKGAMLVVDRSRTPLDGSVLICQQEGEFRLRIFRKHPHPHLQNIERPETTYPLPGYSEDMPDDSIFGVVTWILNNACTGEFDDVPVM